MNDCAGCRHFDEAAGPDGAAFCTHALYARLIADPTQPPCGGDGFVQRFKMDDEDSI